MKKSFIHLIIVVICFPFIFNCSGDDNPDPVVITPPGIATLTFPIENSECTEGNNFTSTESDVTFIWNDASNTDSYQLYLKNLNTQITNNYSSQNSQLALTILRGIPYSWYVVSKNSGIETTQSATWKFYNAGEAVTSYSPFPAELVSPVMGTSLPASTIHTSLQWLGNDVDNDIVNYEVLFGNVNPPTNTIGTTNATNFSVDVAAGNTYYWRIITNDSQNNNSKSEIFQFKVN